MDVVGFSPDEKRSCLRITAAILHIGNIQFVDAGQDNCSIRDNNPLECAAALLEVPAQSLQQAILFRTIQTGVGGRGSTYACPQPVSGVCFYFILFFFALCFVFNPFFMILRLNILVMLWQKLCIVKCLIGLLKKLILVLKLMIQMHILLVF